MLSIYRFRKNKEEILKGLKKRKSLNKKHNDESVYLKNIKNILIDKETKAEKSIRTA